MPARHQSTRIPSTSSARHAAATRSAANLAPQAGQGMNEYHTPPSQTAAPAPQPVRKSVHRNQANRRRENRHDSSDEDPLDSSNLDATPLSTLPVSKRRVPSGAAMLAATPLLTSRVTPRPETYTRSSTEDDELVSRDSNGRYKVPDQLDIGIEGEGEEAGGDDSMMFGYAGEEMRTTISEKADIKAEIAELKSQYRSRKSNDDKLRLYHLIKRDLQDKVASIDEDKWMYEIEDEYHHHF